MKNSYLFIRHYSVVAAVIVITSVILYQFTVPFIKSTTYEIERAAGRNLLNVVYELTNKIHLNIETQHDLILESRKRELKNVIQLASAYIETIEIEFNAGLLSKEEAYNKIYKGLKRFKYGNNDYIWTLSHEGVLVSHPDPEFQNKDIKDNKDLLNIIKIAQTDNEGFYNYKWRRLGTFQEREKTSYFRNFPDWGFIIGSGVYLDDVEADVAYRRQLVIDELRQALINIRVSKTGYIYIFDADLNMLIHPNPNIDKTNFNQQLNPLSGNAIGNELISKADDPNGLYYLWDKPDDPGNYDYEKVSWVRHFTGFDWYIASSVYIDELRGNADILSNRILAVAFVSLVLALFMSYIFIQRLTVPIKRMADTARKVQTGDLTASSNINRDDEIGILSRAFDSMIKRLRENIDTLDARVSARTQELEVANNKERQTQSRLAEAQRMQTVGQLSGGLAHDFNNLLTVIIGNIVAARENYPEQPELAKYLDPAIRASRRGAEITNRLLAFSRQQPLAPVAVSIDKLVEETIVLLGRSLPGNILIKLETPNDTCIANIDSGQMENALVNLAFNAKDSMPQGGRLTFCISLLEDNTHDLFDEPPPCGKYIRIDVIDSGDGFTEKALQKAFEPFFTTKGGQAGSGLGLSMVYGFVKQSGGFIKLHNRKYGGGQVSILLPRINLLEAKMTPVVENREPLLNTLENRLVLLVEDDEDVRIVVRRDLISFGLTVIEAESADEAIPMIQNISDLYMLVSDIITPGQSSGTDLAKIAIKQHPNLPILLISGFTEESIVQHIAGSVGFLGKPFDRAQLKNALNKLISGDTFNICLGKIHDK